MTVQDKGIRIAVVGCGRAARQHVDALRLSGAGLVTAVVDADRWRAEELGRTAQAAVRTLDDVLADAGVDAVAVCTPPGTHADLAVAALRAGKAVLVEKPVAGSVAELDAVLAAETPTAPALAMLQHRGRLPDGALETPWTADATATVEVLRPRPVAHYLAEDWRQDPDRSAGGHIAHLAVHQLDLACRLLGTPVAVAGLADCRDAPGIETRAALAVRFAGGALMSVLTSAHPAPRGERLHLVDADHELTVTDEGTEHRIGGRAEFIPAPPTPQLRAEVYRELRAAVRGEAAPERYALGHARGVTVVLEEVRRLTAVKEPAS
ncbi:oxidoreductase domain protein [Actinobacteria bacterium OK074]|nr:oxidoreductase domain protein [Actinobacteria bacterium OK074]